MRWFRKLFAKKKQPERETEQQREARKWVTILQNVAAYDGTGRGQKDVE